MNDTAQKIRYAREASALELGEQLKNIVQLGLLVGVAAKVVSVGDVAVRPVSPCDDDLLHRGQPIPQYFAYPDHSAGNRLPLKRQLINSRAYPLGDDPKIVSAADFFQMNAGIVFVKNAAHSKLGHSREKIGRTRFYVQFRGVNRPVLNRFGKACAQHHITSFAARFQYPKTRIDVVAKLHRPRFPGRLRRTAFYPHHGYDKKPIDTRIPGRSVQNESRVVRDRIRHAHQGPDFGLDKRVVVVSGDIRQAIVDGRNPIS